MKVQALLPLMAATVAIAPSPASSAILIEDIESAVAIPDNFSFKTELEADFSLVSQTGDLSSISVTAPARINFYALGSESGLENTFLFGALSHTEADYAYDPTRLIGSADFTSPGSLGGLVFMSDGGLPAVPGLSNFGIFLPVGFSGSSYLTDTLVFGYDDGGASDDDYDDFVILAQISPIPEAHTWALLVAGFGLVGWQMRRSRARGLSTAG